MIASIVLLITAFAIWAKRQVLETDTWTETSAELLENEAIRDALADFLVLELYDNVDVEAEIAAPLPERRKPLAGDRRRARQPRRRGGPAPRRGEGPALWRRRTDRPRAAVGNRRGRQRRGLDHRRQRHHRSQADPRLDHREPRRRRGPGLEAPRGRAQLQVADSDEADKVQTGLDVFKAVAWFLVILALVLYVLAVYLAGDRRRETLRAVGIGFIVVGAAVLLGHRAAGNAVVGALSETASADDAVAATWEIGLPQRPRSATG